ncbi:cytochrome c-type biogenesis protein [Actinobacillus pleuropneumoniae]|nr:cytochrome c-type biogenesis protein [Actinobacillus pleuropneumoniae]
MNVGDTVSLQGYDFTFKGIKITDGANYQGGTAEIEISRQGQYESTLNAEKRFYNVSKMGMTEAAIDWGFRRDLYAALGEKLEDGSWAYVYIINRLFAGSGLAAYLWCSAVCSVCLTNVTD